MKGTSFEGASLRGADLSCAELKGTNFTETRLDGVDLSNAILKSVHLANVILSNEKRIGPQMADIQWEDVNFSLVDWSQIAILGDDHVAQQQKADGNVKGKDERLKEYKTAVRANRQLTVALQTQGLNEDAARFAYRAQLLQKRVFHLQMLQSNITLRKRTQAFGAWLFSWFLFLIAGYGYKVWRSFLAYLLVIGTFMVLYLYLDPHLTWYEAIVVSMTAFHGRGFSPSTFSPGDPVSFASAIEAFVGLIIEVTFIATLTRRFFGQ